MAKWQVGLWWDGWLPVYHFMAVEKAGCPRFFPLIQCDEFGSGCGATMARGSLETCAHHFRCANEIWTFWTFTRVQVHTSSTSVHSSSSSSSSVRTGTVTTSSHAPTPNLVHRTWWRWAQRGLRYPWRDQDIYQDPQIGKLDKIGITVILQWYYSNYWVFCALPRTFWQ